MDLPADYREAVPFGMNDVRKNRRLLSGVYDSMGRDEMKRFFYADFIGITRKVVGDAQRQGDCKEFLAHFCTESIAGLLIDEFTDQSGHDSQKAADYFARVPEGSLPAVLQSSGTGPSTGFARQKTISAGLRAAESPRGFPRLWESPGAYFVFRHQRSKGVKRGFTVSPVNTSSKKACAGRTQSFRSPYSAR